MKDHINIEFAEHNAGPENDENAIDFWSSDVQEDEKDIFEANFIESYKSKLMKKFFQK